MINLLLVEPEYYLVLLIALGYLLGKIFHAVLIGVINGIIKYYNKLKEKDGN
jgi:hypothetical protein